MSLMRIQSTKRWNREHCLYKSVVIIKSDNMRSSLAPNNTLRMKLRLLLLLLPLGSFAQIETTAWRDHLPYGKAIDVVMVNNDVYVATPYALFSYNPFSEDVERLNKTNKLSDTGVSCVEYDPETDIIVVGYSNGNLDLLGKEIKVNVPDVKISSLIGDKGIYGMEIFQKKAYLATGFGIVVLDLERFEIKDTYLIGDNGAQLTIHDIEIFQDTIYACTDFGIQKAPINGAFLANFQNWSQWEGLPNSSTIITELEFFANRVFINVRSDYDVLWNYENGMWSEFQNIESLTYNDLWSGNGHLAASASWAYRVWNEELQQVANVLDHQGIPVRANATILSPGGKIYVANDFQGLLIADKYGLRKNAAPAGPSVALTRRIDAYNDNLWIAHGGVNEGFSNLWFKADISALVAESWTKVSNEAGSNSLEWIMDIMDVSIDPLNQNHIYLGSWEEGIIEILDGEIINIFNETNSTLQLGTGFGWAPGWVGVAGVDVSDDGVLWCTNSYTSKNVHARGTDGNFYAFDFSPQTTNNDKADEILVTSNGFVWAIIRSKGIIVLNTNGTLGTQSDDLYKLLNDEEGNGGLPSNEIFCMEEDLDGELWIGTLKGIAIFYTTDDVFTSDAVNAEQILIEQDGNIQILLETEAVTAIEIDGGNRKWVGTQNSGVFLFSADGVEEIYHFTTSNSPLPTNSILDISINHSTGEVYFATESGVVSFMSTATNFVLDIGEITVFPNPVRPNYEGPITIDGLAYNTDVKITDVAGNLVYQTASEGGRAVWNGLTLNGEKAAHGMYLIFCSNSDGSTSQVAKVAVVR